MKPLRCFVFFLPAVAFVLAGCQSESDNSAPEIKSVQTGTHVLHRGTYDNNESDMLLRIMVEVEDADGFDDLDKLIVTFANGNESENTISDGYSRTTNGTEYVNIFYRMSNYGSDNSVRQYPMTGYSLKIQDASGASDSAEFSVRAPEDANVPDGADLYHPEDEDNITGGGDFIKALELPETKTAEYDNSTGEMTLSLINHDARATAIEVYLYIDDEYVGWTSKEDVAGMDNIGTEFDFVFTRDDVEKDSDLESLDLADVEKAEVLLTDGGVETDDLFDGFPTAVSMDNKIIVVK